MLNQRKRIAIPKVYCNKNIKQNLTVGDFIVEQMRRKFQPFFMRKGKRFGEEGPEFLMKRQFEANQPPPKPVLKRRKAFTERKKQNTQKNQAPQSQIYLCSHLGSQIFDDDFEAVNQTCEKYEKLRGKVHNFIRDQKVRVMKMREQKLLALKTKLEKQNKKMSMRQNKNQLQMSEFDNHSFFDFSSLSSQFSVRRPLEQKRMKENKKRANSNKQGKVKQKQKKRKGSFLQEFSFKKTDSVSKLYESGDLVDQQFQQGLAYDIYDPKRINFRKKIHEAKYHQRIKQANRKR